MAESYWDWLNRVASTQATDDLRRGLLERMVSSPSFRHDYRDMLMVLAPVYDCARRLDMDVVALLDEAAGVAPEHLADIVRRFGRRTDITPDAFGFGVEETGDGPRYYNALAGA
jgi:hypothetical protein